MVGAIGKRDVLGHPGITIRCFGWRVFFRTLLAGRNQTFLSILTAAESFRQPTEKAFEIVRRCVRLEQTAHRIYASLAEKFHENGPLREFFAMLARQEREHAELLEVCRIAAMRGRWDGDYLAPWRESVPHLECTMREAEAKLHAVKFPADALWLTIEIESSEINELFRAIAAATDSLFVRKLMRFGNAAREHLGYIRETICELEPSFKPAASECFLSALTMEPADLPRSWLPTSIQRPRMTECLFQNLPLPLGEGRGEGGQLGISGAIPSPLPSPGGRGN